MHACLGVRIAMACAHVCLHIISKIQSDGSRLVLFCKSDEADTLSFYVGGFMLALLVFAKSRRCVASRSIAQLTSLLLRSKVGLQIFDH